ncbi:hypothetical protein A9K55_002299 [Cordyceps militaris]|uniref:Uncharacterized protein n=1 Tax=Cordyceps militaris TaxID=73501 RepID=A0A2H4S6V0_CORMI|nr:hypothetical protein A9K55_002299 [Cordyceps militaris]
MRFLYPASVVAAIAGLAAAADSSTTAVLTQTGFGQGTQVTVCTAQFTLPILAANETDSSGSETSAATPTSSSKSGAASRLLNDYKIAVSVLAVLTLAGTLS